MPKGFSNPSLRTEFVNAVLLWKDPTHSISAFVSGLIADGLRQRLLRGKFGPPKELVEHLSPMELAVLAARWSDAVAASCGIPGTLGSRYRFVHAPEGSDYFEKDRVTALPIEKTIEFVRDELFDVVARGPWSFSDEEAAMVKAARDE